MLKELDDYNWAEVFGEGTGGNCTSIMPSRPPYDNTTSLATFGREDVVVITKMIDGERDERPWVVFGELKDGRWFVARGKCDYTGWDCQASNSGDVARTFPEIVTFGLTEEERDRFGINL